jgi:hypothetical protein
MRRLWLHGWSPVDCFNVIQYSPRRTDGNSNPTLGIAVSGVIDNPSAAAYCRVRRYWLGTQSERSKRSIASSIMSLKRFEKQAGRTVLNWIWVRRFRSCDRDLTASAACPVVSLGISTIKRASSDTGKMVVASAKSGCVLYKENRTFGKNT